MKTRYECGCEFDSEKKEDRVWSKQYWPDKCPRHKQSTKNCNVVVFGSPDIVSVMWNDDWITSTPLMDYWRHSYNSAGTAV